MTGGRWDDGMGMADEVIAILLRWGLFPEQLL
jgi:hypothetical protein